NTINTYATFIGVNGNGIFNQTGGTSIFRYVLGVEVGSGTGSNGTFNVSGGTSSILGPLYIGNNGIGALTVSGSGALTVGGPLVISPFAGNAINLNGGTINAAGLNFNGDPAKFHWTTGTLNVTSSTTWGGGGSTTSTAFGAGLALEAN